MKYTRIGNYVLVTHNPLELEPGEAIGMAIVLVTVIVGLILVFPYLTQIYNCLHP